MCRPFLSSTIKLPQRVGGCRQVVLRIQLNRGPGPNRVSTVRGILTLLGRLFLCDARLCHPCHLQLQPRAFSIPTPEFDARYGLSAKQEPVPRYERRRRFMGCQRGEQRSTVYNVGSRGGGGRV